MIISWKHCFPNDLKSSLEVHPDFEPKLLLIPSIPPHVLPFFIIWSEIFLAKNMWSANIMSVGDVKVYNLNLMLLIKLIPSNHFAIVLLYKFYI